MPFTKFDPTLHGFHFPNSFDNELLFDRVRTLGLCGGMAYASLDYFLAGLPVPTHTNADFGSGHVAPPDGSRLYKYFYRRIVDSFVNHWEQWMNVALNPRFDPAKFTRRHLPDLLGRLDLGQPVPLGLVQTEKLRDIGSNHQVVAIGYEMSADGKSLAIHMYDNNHPDQVRVLRTNPNTVASVEETTVGGASGERWIAFFPLLDYRPHVPDYVDLGLAQGLDVERTGQAVRFVVPPALHSALRRPAKGLQFAPHEHGRPLTARFTVQNFGDFAAHLQSLDLAVTDPGGTVTAVGAMAASTLAAGAKLAFAHTQTGFGGEPGIYECRPRYTSTSAFSIVLPDVATGTDNLERVTVLPAGTRLRV
jgi:hypothetical protein